MGENQERRQARRQKRGVLRVEEILQAAGALFAESGYDNVTISFLQIKKQLRRHSRQTRPTNSTGCMTPCFRPR